jgi:hypothetical protein
MILSVDATRGTGPDREFFTLAYIERNVDPRLTALSAAGKIVDSVWQALSEVAEERGGQQRPVDPCIVRIVNPPLKVSLYCVQYGNFALLTARKALVRPL